MTDTNFTIPDTCSQQYRAHYSALKKYLTGDSPHHSDLPFDTNYPAPVMLPPRDAQPLKSILKSTSSSSSAAPVAEDFFQSPDASQWSPEFLRQHAEIVGQTPLSYRSDRSFHPTSPVYSDNDNENDSPESPQSLAEDFSAPQASMGQPSATSTAEDISASDNERTPLTASDSHGRDGPSLNTFRTVLSHSISVFKPDDKMILDSGATMSGTGKVSRLTNVHNFPGIDVLPAFGDPIRSTKRGTLSGIDMDALLIDGMDQTIVSVSQLCATGHVCIFTAKEVRTYKAADVLPHLSKIALQGKEVARGTVHDGLYLLNPM